MHDEGDGKEDRCCTQPSRRFHVLTSWKVIVNRALRGLRAPRARVLRDVGSPRSSPESGASFSGERRDAVKQVAKQARDDADPERSSRQPHREPNPALPQIPAWQSLRGSSSRRRCPVPAGAPGRGPGRPNRGLRPEPTGPGQGDQRGANQHSGPRDRQGARHRCAAKVTLRAASGAGFSGTELRWQGCGSLPTNIRIPPMLNYLCFEFHATSRINGAPVPMT